MLREGKRITGKSGITPIIDDKLICGWANDYSRTYKWRRKGTKDNNMKTGVCVGVSKIVMQTPILNVKSGTGIYCSPLTRRSIKSMWLPAGFVAMRKYLPSSVSG